MTADSTPRSDGCRWPAEWEPHRATWLAYPHNRETWPGKYEPIPPCFEAFVRTVAERERVCLLAARQNVDRATRARLQSIENVELIDIPTNDAWVRDYGPTFLQAPPMVHCDDNGKRPSAVVWNYNAWGGKYPPFELDNAAGAAIAAHANAYGYAAPLTLEGGAIEGNGGGALLSTQSCLLHVGRNPTANVETVETVLRDYLHIDRVLWLPESQMEGDDTDGHIDQLARFTAANRVVVATPEDDDAAHALLHRNRTFLQSAALPDGFSLDVIPLPLPAPRFYQDRRLPMSYCNFYVLNGAVIVPAFRDRKGDERAGAILAEQFPERDIILLDALDLAWGLGAYHCLSQPEFEL